MPELQLLGAASMDRNVLQPELLDDVVEPSAPTLHRLNEVKLHIGSHDREHDPGKPRARPDICYPLAGIDKARDSGRIDQVAIPDDRQLSRPDEPPLLTLKCKQLRKCHDPL